MFVDFLGGPRETNIDSIKVIFISSDLRCIHWLGEGGGGYLLNSWRKPTTFPCVPPEILRVKPLIYHHVDCRACLLKNRIL